MTTLALLLIFLSDAGGPPILRGVGYDQRLGERVPLDLEFRDEAGQRVVLKQYFGKRPVVLALAYYECPGLCTLVLNGMLRAFRMLTFNIGSEYEVAIVSIDPREMPELAARKKQSYIEKYRRDGAGPGWHFLTGQEPSIAALAKSVGFRYAYDATSGQYAHPAGLVVLTPAGQIARYQFGVEFSPRDLRLSLIEASHERVGTPIDDLLLYCFAYDPATAKYSAAVTNMVRAGGVITVLLLGGLITVFLKRERVR
jgi:protein SCO1/2